MYYTINELQETLSFCLSGAVTPDPSAPNGVSCSLAPVCSAKPQLLELSVYGITPGKQSQAAVCGGTCVLPEEMGVWGWKLAPMHGGGADLSLLPAVTAVTWEALETLTSCFSCSLQGFQQELQRVNQKETLSSEPGCWGQGHEAEQTSAMLTRA